MNKVENVMSAARIHFHIQSWYDEVEDFDSAEFGNHLENGKEIDRIIEVAQKIAQHLSSLFTPTLQNQSTGIVRSELLMRSDWGFYRSRRND
ncbi:hypothetical protein K0M31_006857 [Melipona bicolor]|uniref:Uncharacterized protein n=1 Tax=Melipona bicolor TaxID=60889 RepID=A0AA40FT48_9HYME|nr:hypothetical protein K0M31_006857 [Melipona bicolor]